MRNQRHLTWVQLEELVNSLYQQIKVRLDSQKFRELAGIYGIPTGGSVIAAMLAKYMRLPLLDSSSPSQNGNKPVLIVDDICDSGRTLNPYRDNSDQYTAVIHSRPRTRRGVQVFPNFIVEITEDWIVYPYEHVLVGTEIVTRMLEFIGEDPGREGLRETPRRVVDSWKELFSGYKSTPDIKTFSADYDQMIVERDLTYFSFCEHHIMPFFGKVHICYIPGKTEHDHDVVERRVIGLSKLARIVDIYSRRLQIQERLTKQIADCLETELQPSGVGVIVTGTHFCMAARGVKQSSSVMVTSVVRGVLRSDGTPRQEFLSLLGAAQSGR